MLFAIKLGFSIFKPSESRTILFFFTAKQFYLSYFIR